MFKQILMVGAGGFVGSTLRFLVSKYFYMSFLTGFPWATFIVNIVGSFLIGLFFGLSERENGMSEDTRLFLMVGLCGGFTTFSTFSAESLRLLQNKDVLNLSLYVGCSFVLGLIAVYVGRQLVRVG